MRRRKLTKADRPLCCGHAMRATSSRPRFTYYKCGHCGKSQKVIRPLVSDESEPEDLVDDAFTPSPDDIDAAAAAIRSAWTEEQLASRAVGHAPCELLVGHFLA